MIHHSLWKDKYPIGQIYNFMDYQKKKPFFHEPMKITIGNPENKTYIMVKNIVYQEKQILILKQEQDSQTIFLAEAKLKDGQLQYISKLSDDSIRDIRRMLKVSYHDNLNNGKENN